MSYTGYTQKHYKFWTVLDTIEWIISLNPSKLAKYRDVLTTSFTENNFDGSCINDLDREDLKQFGIINLDDRKAIYKAIITLMATQKRRDSQISSVNLQHTKTDQFFSLSDDDADDAESASKPDYKTLLTAKQFATLNERGYCEMNNDETENKLLVHLIAGWIRINHNGDGIITEIVNAIIYFHGAKFDIDYYVQLKSGEEENASYFLTTKQNIRLSNLLRIQCDDTLECTQVPKQTLAEVLLYLGRHKGIEPDPLPCPVRSVDMRQICGDKWDAIYIDSYDKKTIFEIILAANYLDIKALVHLGAAKIATLIKKLDQREINRIIEEEERYRREQAEKEKESVFGLNDEYEDLNNDKVIMGLDEDEEK